MMRDKLLETLSKFCAGDSLPDWGQAQIRQIIVILVASSSVLFISKEEIVSQERHFLLVETTHCHNPSPKSKSKIQGRLSQGSKSNLMCEV